MEISVHPNTGPVKVLNACFPNSLTPKPASAGSGASIGIIRNVEWNAASKTGTLTIQPEAATAVPVTVKTEKGAKVQVLRMWSALAPYDAEIQKHFETIEAPEGWGGLSGASHYLMLQSRLAASTTP